MTNLHILSSFIILSFLQILSQNQNISQTNQLILDQSLQVTLKANEIKTFQINLIQLNNTVSRPDLFFIAQWPSNDPFQSPLVQLFIDGKSYQTCYNSDNVFSGICNIPFADLPSIGIIKVQVQCLINCTLNIRAILNTKLRLSLNDEIYFFSSDKQGLPLQLQLKIPQNNDYTQIAVYAKIQNINEALQSIQLYANIGLQNTTFPNKLSHYQEGKSIFWGGKGLFFQKQQVQPGDIIKIFLYLSPGTTVDFSAISINGNTFLISLDNVYFDFTTKDQEKLYILNLEDLDLMQNNKTLQISLTAYGGDPFASISLDRQFTHILHERHFTATSTFLITSTLRSQHHYNGSVFIKINSSMPSDYLLMSSLQEINYKLIEPDINYFNELESDQVFNYFIKDNIQASKAGNKSYSFRIDMMQGQMEFGIRRCKTLDDGNYVNDCLIYNKSFIQDGQIVDTFKQIQFTSKKQGDYYYAYFQYDAFKCSLKNNDTFSCAYHLILYNPTNTPASFTISLKKRRYSAVLQQGILTRDFIFQEQYLYYYFSMTSIQDVVEITFYTTTLEGDIVLIGSNSQQYPNLQSNQSESRSSAQNHITFNKQQIRNRIYISAYGLQISEFTLGVIVKRQRVDNTTKDSNSSRSITRLRLSLDVSQQFSLHDPQTTVLFIIQVKQNMNITIDAIPLIGDIDLAILNNNKSMVCSNEVRQSNKKSCDIQVFVGQLYEIRVDASRGNTQRFIIMYYKSSSCTPFALNFPIALQIQANTSQCVKFQISKPADIQISSSLPLQYLISHSLKIQLCINKACKQPNSSHHYKITKNQLSLLCNFSQSQIQSCEIKLNFTSITSFINFNLIVEQSSMDIALLDGIIQSIISSDLTTTSGKYFYYQILSKSSVKLFINSLSMKNHYFAIKFIQESLFMRNDSNIYLPYRKINFDLKQNFDENIYEIITYGINTKMLQINNDISRKFCNKCILTIAVYPLSDNDRQISYLNIQVTQDQSYLKLGQSKTGYLEESEVYVYELDVNSQNNSMIHIKDMDRQSRTEKVCFEASIGSDQNNLMTLISTESLFIKAQDTSQQKYVNIYIRAIKKTCYYEISYMSLDSPLINVFLNSKKPIISHQVNNIHEAYLLYQHNTNYSFKIVQYINSGSISMYVTPILSQTIKTYMQYAQNQYAYSNNPEDDSFEILNSTSSFCSNCKYLIKIKGQTAFNIQVYITNLGYPIPLSRQSPLKQKMAKGNSVSNLYSFHSITAFNITINLNYGSLKVVIKNPNGIELYNRIITNSTEIVIPHNKETQNFTIDYGVSSTLYQIIIQAIEDSRYSIFAEKQAITERIFQGIATYTYFFNNQTQIFQFLNLKDPSKDQHSLNILIQFPYVDRASKISIQAKVFYQKSEGITPQNLLISSIIQSQNTFNIQIPQKKGIYYIRLSTNLVASANILLVKQSLIHLKPQSNAIMNQQSAFQLYSNDKSVMVEIFTCSGDLTFDGSRKYSDLLSPERQYEELILQQSNYGGHFVISIQNIYGQYYIQIKNKNPKTKLSYLINYYYYSSNDILPYKLLNLQNRQISYEITDDRIIFQLSTIFFNVESDFTANLNIQYYFYISNNKSIITQYSNCRIGNVYSFKKNIQKRGQQYIYFEFTFDNIASIVPKGLQYYVSSQAIVNLPQSSSASKYPSNLRLIYDTVECTKIIKSTITEVSPSQYSFKSIILWIFLPIGIAGLLLYIAIRYLIKNYRGLSSNQLMQEDDNYGSSNNVIKKQLPDDSPLANKSNSNAVRSLKEEIQ